MSTPCRPSTTPRWSRAPSRCTRRGCGRSTTPDISARSSATPTATTSRPSSTVPHMADIDAARELLRDSFTRLIEHVDDLTDGLTDAVAYYRHTPQANTITWLIWHSARIQDAQLCDIAGL